MSETINTSQSNNDVIVLNNVEEDISINLNQNMAGADTCLDLDITGGMDCNIPHDIVGDIVLDLDITGGGMDYSIGNNVWTSSSMMPLLGGNTTDANFSGSIHLDGKNADITMGDISLREWMKSVNERLCILQPKPELLEKYHALKEAYEHYRTLEALLTGAE